MNAYDFAIAWNWEFDHDFISGIEYECRRMEISTFRIDPWNHRRTYEEICRGGLFFQAFFDRASDADPEFLPLVRWMEANVGCVINPRDRVLHAIDKATMHLEFMTHGLYVPTTVILSSYHEQPHIGLDTAGLESLGRPFVIKPANTTGGGKGVVLDVSSLDDVVKARQEQADDKYLLQETIIPKLLDGRRAWFRVYFAFGETIPCWWDNVTHRYTELLPEEEARYGLEGLRGAVRTIRGICGLDFFSSEVALTDDGRLVIVDYVNEVCDMRYQSVHSDGAPDAVVHRIEKLIAGHVKSHLIPEKGI